MSFRFSFLGKESHTNEKERNEIKKGEKRQRKKKYVGKMSLQNKCIFQFLISIFSLRCKKDNSRSLFKRRWSGRKKKLALLFKFIVWVFRVLFSFSSKSRKYFSI